MPNVEHMTDKALFREMINAEDKYNELYVEYRKRGLAEKPYVELSGVAVSPKTHEFRKGLWQRIKE